MDVIRTHELILKYPMPEDDLRLWAKALLMESGSLLPAEIKVKCSGVEIIIVID
jgi:hypothetical protein